MPKQNLLVQDVWSAAKEAGAEGWIATSGDHLEISWPDLETMKAGGKHMASRFPGMEFLCGSANRTTRSYVDRVFWDKCK